MGKVILMKGFDSTTYSVNDFLEWYERKQLILSPKFQRRSVWKDVAKSFLIDSILRGKPLPKIFIRQLTDIRTRTTIREVVDGQQRLRTILDYINDGFKVKKVHNEECGEKYFSQLDEAAQSSILTYKFSVDTLIGVEDSEIMDIFARLNTYTTPLNKQELINAEFYGYFKQLVYGVSHKYNKFWIENKIFSEYQTMRMNEVELTADLFIACMDGIQNRKRVKIYYKEYDEQFDEKDMLEDMFDETISLITRLFGDHLKKSVFRKPALFYALFLALCNLRHNIPGLPEVHVPAITGKTESKIKSCLDRIEVLIDSEDLNKDELDFVISISRATSDGESRKTRTAYIARQLKEALSD
ncbi:MAG: DUF262 domain-containing protein [Roseburia sp.]|nr:DUF262 domain-containing protein [Roseburia sp.]